MTLPRGWPDRLALAGLAYLVVALLVAPPAGLSAPLPARLLVGALCALPLGVLLATAPRGSTRWGTWVALLMIPYVTLSVGAWLVTPAARLPGIVFATVASTVFFAGILAGRRPGRGGPAVMPPGEALAEARRYRVSGQVQGVFFRASTARVAAGLGIRGHARNLPDGSVEVLAIGTAAALAGLEQFLRRGPPRAAVTGIEQRAEDARAHAGVTDFSTG